MRFCSLVITVATVVVIFTTVRADHIAYKFTFHVAVKAHNSLLMTQLTRGPIYGIIIDDRGHDTGDIFISNGLSLRSSYQNEVALTIGALEVGNIKSIIIRLNSADTLHLSRIVVSKCYGNPVTFDLDSKSNVLGNILPSVTAIQCIVGRVPPCRDLTVELPFYTGFEYEMKSDGPELIRRHVGTGVTFSEFQKRSGKYSAKLEAAKSDFLLLPQIHVTERTIISWWQCSDRSEGGDLGVLDIGITSGDHTTIGHNNDDLMEIVDRVSNDDILVWTQKYLRIPEKFIGQHIYIVFSGGKSNNGHVYIDDVAIFSEISIPQSGCFMEPCGYKRKCTPQQYEKVEAVYVDNDYPRRLHLFTATKEFITDAITRAFSDPVSSRSERFFFKNVNIEGIIQRQSDMLVFYNGKVVTINGDKFKPQSSTNINVYQGIPKKFDGVIETYNGKSYVFFKGKNFYQYNLQNKSAKIGKLKKVLQNSHAIYHEPIGYYTIFIRDGMTYRYDLYNSQFDQQIFTSGIPLSIAFPGLNVKCGNRRDDAIAIPMCKTVPEPTTTIESPSITSKSTPGRTLSVTSRNITSQMYTYTPILESDIASVFHGKDKNTHRPKHEDPSGDNELMIVCSSLGSTIVVVLIVMFMVRMRRKPSDKSVRQTRTDSTFFSMSYIERATETLSEDRLPNIEDIDQSQVYENIGTTDALNTSTYAEINNSHPEDAYNVPIRHEHLKTLNYAQLDILDDK